MCTTPQICWARNHQGSMKGMKGAQDRVHDSTNVVDGTFAAFRIHCLRKFVESIPKPTVNTVNTVNTEAYIW